MTEAKDMLLPISRNPQTSKSMSKTNIASTKGLNNLKGIKPKIGSQVVLVIRIVMNMSTKPKRKRTKIKLAIR